MDTFDFNEYLKREREKLDIEKEFNDAMLAAAIDGAPNDDKRLSFMIAVVGGEITDILIDSFISPEFIKALDFETKKDVYVYLSAVANGLSEYAKQIKEK